MTDVKHEFMEDEGPLFVPQAPPEETETARNIESVNDDLTHTTTTGSLSDDCSNAPTTPTCTDAPGAQIATPAGKTTTKTRAKPKPKPRAKKPKEPKAPKTPTARRAPAKKRGPAKKQGDATSEMEDSNSPAQAPPVTVEQPSSMVQEGASVFRPSAEKFPELPDEANPIDKAIFQRLAEYWDEEAMQWTDEMRASLMTHLPRARVTKSTYAMSNHNLSKLLRQGLMEPDWGSFVILRVMFGPTSCFHQKWFAKLAQRYPQATEPACDGVIPSNFADVLSGKAEFVAPSKTKRKINQLGPDKSRPGGKRIKTGADGEAYIAKIMLGGANEDGKSIPLPSEVMEAFKDTIEVVDRFNPQDTIQLLKKQYNDQMNQIRVLEKSNSQIMDALNQYRAYVGMLRGLHNNFLTPSSIGTDSSQALESGAADDVDAAISAPANAGESQGESLRDDDGAAN